MNESTPEPRQAFAGIVALVTGAAQGIGRAIANELHGRGAQLVRVDCNTDGVKATAEALRHFEVLATFTYEESYALSNLNRLSASCCPEVLLKDMFLSKQAAWRCVGVYTLHVRE